MTIPPDPPGQMLWRRLPDTRIGRGDSPYLENCPQACVGGAYPAIRRTAAVCSARTGKLADSLRRQAQVNDRESG